MSTCDFLGVQGIFPHMSAGIDRERLRELLIEKKRSGRDVSRKAELGETAVKDILSGKSRRPEFDTLLKIATELGVEVSDFTASGPMLTPPRATQRSDDVKIVPRVLEVRYRVRAGQWQQVEFEEPPEDIGYPAVIPQRLYRCHPPRERTRGPHCLPKRGGI